MWVINQLLEYTNVYFIMLCPKIAEFKQTHDTDKIETHKLHVWACTASKQRVKFTHGVCATLLLWYRYNRVLQHHCPLYHTFCLHTTLYVYSWRPNLKFSPHTQCVKSEQTDTRTKSLLQVCLMVSSKISGINTTDQSCCTLCEFELSWGWALCAQPTLYRTASPKISLKEQMYLTNFFRMYLNLILF